MEYIDIIATSNNELQKIRNTRTTYLYGLCEDLYPLKFTPILKEKIWGGQKLGEIYHRYNAENVGESWVLSSYAGDESVLSNGFLAGKTLTQLIENYGDALLGEQIFEQFGANFPLLFKLIDANDRLSIQVHPDDQTAGERHKCFGKTEMWYVVDAEPDSELIIGFKQDSTKEEYAAALENGTVETLLQRVKVQRGDVFFIPAGLVHAIGKGVLIAEIQQSSDITYRVYDYQRKDKNGCERELHLAWAVDVIDYQKSKNPKTPYTLAQNEIIPLAQCNYFTTNLLQISNTFIRDLKSVPSFVVYLCVEGQAEFMWNGIKVPVNQGETVLLPAAADQVQIIPSSSATLLEVFISHC